MNKTLVICTVAALCLWQNLPLKIISFLFLNHSCDNDRADSYDMGEDCTQDLGFNSSFIIHPRLAQASQKIRGNDISLASWQAISPHAGVSLAALATPFLSRCRYERSSSYYGTQPGTEMAPSPFVYF